VLNCNKIFHFTVVTILIFPTLIDLCLTSGPASYCMAFNVGLPTCS